MHDGGGRVNLAEAIGGAGPVVTIRSPAEGAGLAFSPATFKGTASDPDGMVASVGWTNQTTGKSGAASGSAESWNAQVPLAQGKNTIVVTAVDGTGVSGSATRTVVYQVPVIDLNPSALSLAAEEGTSEMVRTVTLRNTGGATLSWKLLSAESWVSASPLDETLAPGEAASLGVSIRPLGLALGEHKAALEVSGGTAPNSPQALPVTLKVVKPGTLPLGPEAGEPPIGTKGGGRDGRCGLLGFDLLLVPLLMRAVRRRRFRQRPVSFRTNFSHQFRGSRS